MYKVEVITCVKNNIKENVQGFYDKNPNIKIIDIKSNFHPLVNHLDTYVFSIIITYKEKDDEQINCKKSIK